MTDNVPDLQHRIDVRINSSLDLDSVLQEVVDSARILTNARYGIIVNAYANGEIDEFVSSRFTQGEKRQMVAWP